MGWSCAKDADDTMQKWTAACIAQTGSQNVYKAGGQTYFWDISRTEHDDGAITGTILRMEGNGDINGVNHAYRAGTFRINGDGTIARAPAFLKAAAQRARHAHDLELKETA